MVLLPRSKAVLRVIAITLLIVTLQSAFLPHYAFALTTGPHQPEYTSYESPGSTDMVNLVTGDFTFSIPALDVPAPGGDFSLPLTYNAGIGTEQEASWVGLGWTMNPGAVTRQYTGFPDDAGGETQEITVKDLTGVRGWTSTLLGLGNIGWNNQVGHYGQLSIGIGWDESGMTVDPLQLGLTILTIATTVEALRTLSPAAEASKTAIEAAKTTLAMEAVSQGISMATTMLMGGQTPVAPSSGYWKYKKETEQRILHKNYWIWLDKTRQEDMYGALYLHKANESLQPFANNDEWVNLAMKVNGTSIPMEKFSNANDQGAASDISYYMASGQSYSDAKSPATLALDDYNVMAAGISGNIQPYRLEIGSVSMPRKMSSSHSRFAPVKYQDYKVPFIYKGALSNNYYHHVGAATSITSPSFYDNGLTATQSNSNRSNNTLQTLNFDDIIFGSTNRIRSDVSGIKKVPQGNDVTWLSNEEIKNTPNGFASGFIDYFAGAERVAFRAVTGIGVFKTFNASSNDFTDGLIQLKSPFDVAYFTSGSPHVSMTLTIYDKDASGQRIGTPTSLVTTGQVQGYSLTNKTVTVNTANFLTSVTGKSVDILLSAPTPPKSELAIGGYAITGTDGLTYHFALPVYDYNQKTRIEDKSDSDKNTEIKRNDPFANTWVLTAITGSDFIDRSSTGEANGVIDEYDWGHWVKFNYGLHSNNYKWRIPYAANTFTIDAENSSKTYSEGQKQTYYLNSIETRTHVALFFKDERNDNKDATGVVKSLKLTEINLLTKESYKKLITDYAFPNVSGTLNVNLMSSYINTTSDRQNFLYKNTLKRIKFNHNYLLAQGAPNSSLGKLTLNRLSIVGKNDMKFIPDYLFSYNGSNYNYDANKWDGWGMYTPNGDATNASHKASNSDMHGAAWSLTKVTTPSGAEIQVDYERDSYASVSGIPVTTAHRFDRDLNIVGGTSLNEVKVLASNCALKAGDQVRIVGSVVCLAGGTSVTFDQIKTVQSVVGTLVTFTSNFVTTPSCFANNSKIAGTIQPQSTSRKGGNLRVKSLTTVDGTIQKKVRYIYSEDETPTGLTSGVVAQEPDYINNDLETQPANVNVPGYPVTPVMYKKVTVLSGNLATDADYHTKAVYEFETPDESMLTVSMSNPNTKTWVASAQNDDPFHPYVWNDYLTRVHNKVSDRTSRIGSLKSIKVFDKPGVLQSSTVLTYTQGVTNPNDLGVFSEGTLMVDRIKEDSYEQIYKLVRTTVLKYPNVLKSVVTTKDGFASKSENLKWDLYSSQVLEKLSTSPGGITTKSVVVPAYTKYSELGPKGLASTNKNMLSQETAKYFYRTDAAGNATGLISGSVTTWNKDWLYRSYSSTTGTHENVAEGPGVWRKHKSYVWIGDVTRQKTDGTHTFSPSDEFAFSLGASNPGWKYLGETKQYDHLTNPVESKDFKDMFSSSKFGYENRMVIADASNAEYQEIAFSSGEDKMNTSPAFFGGEVAVGDGIVLRKSAGQVAEVHTGDAVVKVTGTGKSFTFKSKGIKPNSYYKSSVWTNSTNGRIYLKINGVDQPLSTAPQESIKVGNWYRITYEFKTPSSVTSLETGVTTTGGDVLFDDFRFQPSDAVMTCYVFDPLDFSYAPNATTLTRYEYVLDNDNLFTKYEYNERSQLVKTYIESIRTKGVRLITESKSDYRRFHVNQ